MANMCCLVRMIECAKTIEEIMKSYLYLLMMFCVMVPSLYSAESEEIPQWQRFPLAQPPVQKVAFTPQPIQPDSSYVLIRNRPQRNEPSVIQEQPSENCGACKIVWSGCRSNPWTTLLFNLCVATVHAPVRYCNFSGGSAASKKRDYTPQKVTSLEERELTAPLLKNS